MTDAAKNLVILDCCCRIEKSLWPEQTSNINQSAYTQLREEYNDELLDFKTALTNWAGGNPSGPSGDSTGNPRWYFGDGCAPYGSWGWNQYLWWEQFYQDAGAIRRPATEVTVVRVPDEAFARGQFYDPSGPNAGELPTPPVPPWP